jgi:hypothetical protein
MGGMESLLESKKKSRNVVEEGVCAAAGGEFVVDPFVGSRCSL